MGKKDVPNMGGGVVWFSAGTKEVVGCSNPALVNFSLINPFLLKIYPVSFPRCLSHDLLLRVEISISIEKKI